MTLSIKGECKMLLLTFLTLFIVSNLNEALEKTSSLSDLRFCGYQHTDDYTYVGNDTSIDEFPWLALIIYEQDPDVEPTPDVKVGCGGSLINDRYVLSTAICLRFRTSYAAAVRLGEHNIVQEFDCTDYKGINECANPLLDIPIEKTIRHPGFQYVPYAKDAIALFRLAKRVTYSDFVRPICLPVAKLRVATPGDPVTATGFGSTKEKGTKTVIKKRVSSVLISNELCITQYYGPNPNNHSYFVEGNYTAQDVISDRVICTNDVEGTASFACEGDMGAPVMYVSKRKQWHMEGLVSWGSTVCKVGVPVTHTKIRPYMDWIAENIED